MARVVYKIKGMHCSSCELLIEDSLGELPGINQLKADYKLSQVEISSEASLDSAEVAKALKKVGYTLGESSDLPFFTTNKQHYLRLLKALILVGLLYLLITTTGLFNWRYQPLVSGPSLGLLVGLIAGFSSCLALIGGLVVSWAAKYVASYPDSTKTQRLKPQLMFNGGRILGFFVFGGLLGWLGKSFQLSNSLVGLLTLVVSLLMIYLGLKLLNISPRLTKHSLTLPKAIYRFFGFKESSQYSHWQAVLAGTFTFFVPCGFTQVMQLYALSSGSFMAGALALGLFAIGTSVGLLSVAGIISFFDFKKQQTLFLVVGLIVLGLGLYNLSNAKNLLLTGPKQDQVALPVMGDQSSLQVVKMTQNDYGYAPNKFTIKVNQPVRWLINSTSQYSCASYIKMPAFGINQPLKLGENIIDFYPTKVGRVSFTCSMGMFRGEFNIVK